MKGRLLWLLWIGIIGIAWNLILIGYGLWEQRQLTAEARSQVRLRALCVAAVAWLRACWRPQVESSSEAEFRGPLTTVLSYPGIEPRLKRAS